MIANFIARTFPSLALFLSCGLFPAYAEVAHVCNVDELFNGLSAESVDYEKIEKTLLGISSEGTNVKYYYSTETLKKIKSAFYSSVGQTEIQYYFSAPDTYAAKVTHYYYIVPTHNYDSRVDDFDFRIKDFQIVSTNKSEFAVCQGELVRGIFDELVVEDFEYARGALKTILEAAPR